MIRAFLELRSREARRRRSLLLLTTGLALVQIDDRPSFIQLNRDFCSFWKVLGFRLLQEKRKGLISLRRVQLDLFVHFANVYKLSRYKLMLALFSFQVDIDDGAVLINGDVNRVAGFELATLATRLILTELIRCPFFCFDGQLAAFFDDFALEVFVRCVSFSFSVLCSA